MRITFAVVRNGAVWKCWDHYEQALDQARSVAAFTNKHEQFEGFDEANRSAVVTRPVTVTIERLEGNTTAEVLDTWIAGIRQSDAPTK